MTTLGAVFRPQLPPERLRAVALAADDAGLDELWLWEDCFLESGIATATAALAWTRDLTVGVGLLPVPLRNVALTAMETATLHRLFPDRVRVAIGHGVQDWMTQVGARPASPLTLLREHLDALRALLAGERVTVQGRYVTLDDVALDYPPTTPAPVMAGARGPRTLHLSGQASDGTVLDAGTGEEGLRRARHLTDQGHKEAHRTGHHPITVYLLAATGPGAAQRMDAELRQEGLPAHFGVTGDATAIAQAVQRMADAGADTVVLQPTADEPDPEGFVGFTAQQVRPLLR